MNYLFLTRHVCIDEYKRTRECPENLNEHIYSGT